MENQDNLENKMLMGMEDIKIFPEANLNNDPFPFEESEFVDYSSDLFNNSVMLGNLDPFLSLHANAGSSSPSPQATEEKLSLIYAGFTDNLMGGSTSTATSSEARLGENMGNAGLSGSALDADPMDIRSDTVTPEIFPEEESQGGKISSGENLYGKAEFTVDGEGVAAIEKATTSAKKGRKTKGSRAPRKGRASKGNVDFSTDFVGEILDVDLLKLRPPQQKHVKKPVPEHEKDAGYFAKRDKNTLAARKCRAKKRRLDEQRVAIINRLRFEYQKAKASNEELKMRCAAYDALKEELIMAKRLLNKFLDKEGSKDGSKDQGNPK